MRNENALRVSHHAKGRDENPTDRYSLSESPTPRKFTREEREAEGCRRARRMIAEARRALWWKIETARTDEESRAAHDTRHALYAAADFLKRREDKIRRWLP